MKCPKCGSENVQFATSTSGGGFSFGNACCGYILAGPLGILCGACGSSVHTDEFWICHNCGNKFTIADVENQNRKAQAQVQQAEKAEKEYQGNKRTLEASGKTHEEIEAACLQARKEQDVALSQYRKMLDMYTSGVVKGLRIYAIILKCEDLKYVFWVLLGIGLMLLFTLPMSEIYICACLSAISIVGLILCYPAAKKAKAAIARVDPEILTLTNEIQKAGEKRRAMERLRKASQSVKTYEYNSKKKI